MIVGDKGKAGLSKHEARFESLWMALKGPTLVRQHLFAAKFAIPRKWRMDYASLDAKVAIELDGGIWIMGRHNRGSGYLKDLEKMNAATAAGWRVFRLADRLINADEVKRIIEVVNESIERANLN